ncbi:hypothetical protein FEFOOCAP_00054 [Yersinia phage vB_YpM_Tongde]|nr:hypothetical protein FEFOOCAP_00054 [Yersinia phage vB_YpM_Tongde]
MTKERECIFPERQKKPIIERLAQLIRHHPSRSAAARAWGVNINTLNSYFKNELDPPMPRENLLAKIADYEGISLDWLKYGDNATVSPENTKNTKHGDIRDNLRTMLGFLTDDEVEQLTSLLARKGVETMLYLLDEDNIRLLQMDRIVKEKILGIHPRTPEEQAFADNEARECDTTHPLRHEQSKSLTTKKQQAR